jgi:hypothetical protein
VRGEPEGRSGGRSYRHRPRRRRAARRPRRSRRRSAAPGSAPSASRPAGSRTPRSPTYRLPRVPTTSVVDAASSVDLAACPAALRRSRSARMSFIAIASMYARLDVQKYEPHRCAQIVEGKRLRVQGAPDTGSFIHTSFCRPIHATYSGENHCLLGLGLCRLRPVPIGAARRRRRSAKAVDRCRVSRPRCAIPGCRRARA